MMRSVSFTALARNRTSSRYEKKCARRRRGRRRMPAAACRPLPQQGAAAAGASWLAGLGLLGAPAPLRWPRSWQDLRKRLERGRVKGRPGGAAGLRTAGAGRPRPDSGVGSLTHTPRTPQSTASVLLPRQWRPPYYLFRTLKGCRAQRTGGELYL
jgi:hypothetical protein